MRRFNKGFPTTHEDVRTLFITLGLSLPTFSNLRVTDLDELTACMKAIREVADEEEAAGLPNGFLSETARVGRAMLDLDPSTTVINAIFKYSGNFPEREMMPLDHALSASLQMNLMVSEAPSQVYEGAFMFFSLLDHIRGAGGGVRGWVRYMTPQLRMEKNRDAVIALRVGLQAAQSKMERSRHRSEDAKMLKVILSEMDNQRL